MSTECHVRQPTVKAPLAVYDCKYPRYPKYDRAWSQVLLQCGQNLLPPQNSNFSYCVTGHKKPQVATRWQQRAHAIYLPGKVMALGALRVLVYSQEVRSAANRYCRPDRPFPSAWRTDGGSSFGRSQLVAGLLHAVQHGLRYQYCPYGTYRLEQPHCYSQAHLSLCLPMGVHIGYKKSFIKQRLSRTHNSRDGCF